MKAEHFLKQTVDKYREEVSGGGVKIEVPGVCEPFWVFPVQPEETHQLYKLMSEDPTDDLVAIRMIVTRAKYEDGRSMFDNVAERDKAELILRTKTSQNFSRSKVAKVIRDISDAYDVTSIEEAGND